MAEWVYNKTNYPDKKNSQTFSFLPIIKSKKIFKKPDKYDPGNDPNNLDHAQTIDHKNLFCLICLSRLPYNHFLFELSLGSTGNTDSKFLTLFINDKSISILTPFKNNMHHGTLEHNHLHYHIHVGCMDSLFSQYFFQSVVITNTLS